MYQNAFGSLKMKFFVSKEVLKYNKCTFTAAVTPSKCNQCGVSLAGNSTLSSQSDSLSHRLLLPVCREQD